MRIKKTQPQYLNKLKWIKKLYTLKFQIHEKTQLVINNY